MQMRKALFYFLLLTISLVLISCESDSGNSNGYTIASMEDDPGIIYADSNDATYSEIRVVVEDESGNLVQGARVLFESDLGVVQAERFTDETGTAISRFFDEGETGTAHVMASIEGSGENGQQVSVEIREYPYYSIVHVTANPETIYADNGITSSEISVLVADHNGYTAINAMVYFQTDIGQIEQSALTDSMGVARAEFTDNFSLGTANITCYAGSSVGNIIVVIAPSPEIIELNLNIVSSEIQVNSVRSVAASAVNVIGTVPDGTPIEFSTELGFFQVSATDNTYLGKSTISITTNGTARAFYNSGTQSGSSLMTAAITDNGIILSDEETMNIIPGVPAQITIIPRNWDDIIQGTIGVGSFDNLYVWAYIYDSFGNPVSPDYVAIFSCDLGIIQTPIPVNEEGIAISTFSPGTQAGVSHITVELDNAIAETAITIIAGEARFIQFVDQEDVFIYINGVGGPPMVTLDVQLLDMYGNLDQVPHEVYFKFQERPEGSYPEGSNLNNDVYNLVDSTSTISYGGIASVTVCSGIEEGNIEIRAWFHNFGEYFYTIKSNIYVVNEMEHGAINKDSINK